MFFEQKTLAIEILDVFEVKQKNLCVKTPGRSFDALSFRRNSNTEIITEKQRLRLGTNAVCFFPAGVGYTRKTATDDLVVVHFHAFNYRGIAPEAFTPPHPDAYATLFEEMLRLWRGKAPGYRYEAAALLYRILAVCYRDNEPPLTVDDRIEAGAKYIREHCLRQDFSIAEAAKRCFMSEAYFRRLFHAQFGESPKRYVISRRLKHAASLLSTGYYSVADTAALCGYRDAKHFSVEFKDAMGISPSNYAYRRIR
ncbi:MAG: helix-turn-helix transcriptional regulator [Ruminococcaceae bacterium]|nr:helix-turn-helix transcriptional regulator [Oscillospiraceae bacterium]